MQELRGELDKLLMEKIERPEMDLVEGESVCKQQGAKPPPSTGKLDTKEGDSVTAGAGAREVISTIVRLLKSEDDMLAQKMDNSPAKDDVVN